MSTKKWALDKRRKDDGDARYVVRSADGFAIRENGERGAYEATAMVMDSARNFEVVARFTVVDTQGFSHHTLRCRTRREAEPVARELNRLHHAWTEQGVV